MEWRIGKTKKGDKRHYRKFVTKDGEYWISVVVMPNKHVIIVFKNQKLNHKIHFNEDIDILLKEVDTYVRTLEEEFPDVKLDGPITCEFLIVD